MFKIIDQKETVALYAFLSNWQTIISEDLHNGAGNNSVFSMHLYVENFLHPTKNYIINAYHMGQPAMEKINQELQQPRIGVENKGQ